jgi:anti-sigma regulatory factor (Ser/Thr protein kinase)
MTCGTTVADIRTLVARISYMDEVPVPPLDEREACMASEWPLRSFLELGAYREAVPCARLHAREVVWEWGFSKELSRDCESIVSELVTNAVQASQSLGRFTTVRLWLMSDKEKVLILVWDANPQPPVPAGIVPGLMAEGGRGLFLVGAMSEKWSLCIPADRYGKVVWALCGEAAE